MKQRIITISRQFGSGGRTIGKEVASRLGIPCYDQELIEKIAEKSGFAKEYIAEHGEHTTHGSWLASMFSTRDMKGNSNQDYLWNIQRNVILELGNIRVMLSIALCGSGRIFPPYSAINMPTK